MTGTHDSQLSINTLYSVLYLVEAYVKLLLQRVAKWDCISVYRYCNMYMSFRAGSTFKYCRYRGADFKHKVGLDRKMHPDPEYHTRNY